MRVIAVDAGNSRIKWGLAENGKWRALGAAAIDEFDRHAAQAWPSLPAPARIAVANVAGVEVGQRLAALFARHFAAAPVAWLRAVPSAGGVTNGYDDPGQLGVDRWAALVAARARHAGDSLVVMAGTATTIDRLDAQGTFRGGMILPGLDLMRRALAAGTAGLPLARGEYRDEPRSTSDAIESGCRAAQAGAIERAYARLPAGAPCFLSGGGVPAIAPLLAFATREVEHLVLEGVLRLAQ
ncbi:MAG: type III pantothenate kinase [Burkholderiales bacterium]|nr:type III pantothenate kinase [Burkholderiales bacterium]